MRLRAGVPLLVCVVGAIAAMDHVAQLAHVARPVVGVQLVARRCSERDDFGIATLGDAPPDEIVGKPSFMSPEAIRGEPCDGRTDLFAAGVIAWELLTHQKRPAAVAQWVASLFVEDQPTRIFGGATVKCLGAAA
jgi:hypothetical protein